MVVDLSEGEGDAFAYLSDFTSGRLITFRYQCSTLAPPQSLTLLPSLRTGKSWSLQTEETQPANNQFPIDRCTGYLGLA